MYINIPCKYFNKFGKCKNPIRSFNFLGIKFDRSCIEYDDLFGCNCKDAVRPPKPSNITPIYPKKSNI